MNDITPVRTLRTLAVMVSLVLLSACPPPGGDDDDSATPPDTGPAPVVTGVVLCEVPALANCEAPRFGVRFGITATDEDDNMNNPWWALLIEGNNPMDGFLEANLPSGGTFNLNICGEWARGGSLDFELWIQDEEGNDSNRWEDQWVIPVSAGNDDCEPDGP